MKATNMMVVILMIALLTLSACAPKILVEDAEIEKQLAIEDALSKQKMDSDAVYAEKLDKINEQLAVLQTERDNEKELKEKVLVELEDLRALNEAKEEEKVTEVAFSGEVIDDLYLGDNVGFVIDDGDLQKLLDGEIRFDDEDYDVHEEFVADSNKASVLYSAVDDEELGDRPALGFTQEGALEYKYVFDDPIALVDISDDEPLEIVFLGQDFTIVEASSSEITFRSGLRFYMEEGESVTYDGHNVELSFVGQNGRVLVTVDGESDSIDEYDTEEINGVDVLVDEILVNDRRGSATLILGVDTLIDQKDGDEFLEIDDSPFKFEIETSSGNLDSLSVVYDERRKDVDDDEFPPLYVGDELSFPYNFLTVRFDKIVDNDYVKFEFEFDGFSEELEDETDIDNDECIRIHTSEDDIEINNEDTNEVFVCSNGNAYYQDTSDDWYEGDISDIALVNDDEEYTLSIDGSDRLNIEHTMDVLIVLDTVWAEERFGAEEDEAEGSDILLNGNNVGEEEDSVLTPYGAIIEVPEDNADRDEFTFFVPQDRVSIELVVY